MQTKFNSVPFSAAHILPKTSVFCSDKISDGPNTEGWGKTRRPFHTLLWTGRNMLDSKARVVDE